MRTCDLSSWANLSTSMWQNHTVKMYMALRMEEHVGNEKAVMSAWQACVDGALAVASRYSSLSNVSLRRDYLLFLFRSSNSTAGLANYLGDPVGPCGQFATQSSSCTSLSSGQLAAAIVVPISLSSFLLLLIFWLCRKSSARQRDSEIEEDVLPKAREGKAEGKAPGLGPDTTIVVTDVQVQNQSAIMIQSALS